VEEKNLNKLVDYVHFAETSKGANTNPYALHNYCKGLGKSNEYGYGGMQSMMCFESHEQATRVVERWFKDKLASMSVGEATCHYHSNYLTYTGK